MKCVICGVEFELGRAANKVTCSTECSKVHQNMSAKQRLEAKGKPRRIRAVGEWNGVALPAGVAKRLGIN